MFCRESTDKYTLVHTFVHTGTASDNDTCANSHVDIYCNAYIDTYGNIYTNAFGDTAADPDGSAYSGTEQYTYSRANGDRYRDMDTCANADL